MNLGYLDVFRAKYPNKQIFSWWDYRAGSWQNNKGMRIDHILTSPITSDAIEDISIYKQFREKDTPSDHVPVTLTLRKIT